eukprot:CAMPEP_0170190788 /NCGR_PEP_ID=MMETSP0040_2-20121228/50157_1 /TAXON_ID=641309 /ORGANISM="Lotharella oceanica, Strain CCMP622" /LENGTH=296 /DNA_ID=CAMNT_0010438727 /DNA_START=36 /DNA_END=927 /DNA_ORIENTATION=-
MRMPATCGAWSFCLRQFSLAERLSAVEALAHPFIKGEASTESFDPLVLKSLKSFTSANKFKNRILGNLVHTLNDEEVKKLEDEFKKLDLNGDGKVQISELSRLFSELKPQGVEEIMRTLDTDGDGELSIKEFHMAFVHRKVSYVSERMWKVFGDFDLNGDGKLDREEIGKALGGDLSKEEVNKIFDKVDRDKSGKVDYAEFIDAWYNVKVSPEPPKSLQKYPEMKESRTAEATASAEELGTTAAATDLGTTPAATEHLDVAPDAERATREIDEQKENDPKARVAGAAAVHSIALKK